MIPPYKSTFAFVFLIAVYGSTQGQPVQLPLQFNGEVRVRSEVDGRDFDNSTDVNTYTLLRTRFGVRAQPLEDVNVYIQVQDARPFGDEPRTVANTAAVDLHQAYFEVRRLWNRSIYLKIGRQEMAYGDQRLIGTEVFSNVGRSLDGIKVSFGENRRLDVFATIISESSSPGMISGQENEDFNFFGLYYKHRKMAHQRFDGYLLLESNLAETPAGDNELNRATAGFYGIGRFSKQLNWESEVAYQFGKRQGQNVSAYMLTGSLGYKLSTANGPELRIGLDYLSGMRAGDSEYGVFNTLFATNHKFYGFMDYFLDIPVQTQNNGLRDLMLVCKLPINIRLRFDAQLHDFRSASGSASFGNELDTVFSYLYNAVASFQFGLTFFLPGERMKETFASGDLGIWSYAMFLVRF